MSDLRTRFDTPEGTVHAVNGVDLSLHRGETLGIVGESGSGKSVLSLSILGLIPQPPGRIDSGKISFDGVDLLSLAPDAMRRMRGERIAMVFQDPMTSLNPFLRIGDQVGEALIAHRGETRKAARARALELLREVGIPDPSARLDAYPHQFSGGMRQRVMIAMALALEPDLLIADEPTTALDVTVQAQILELLSQVREEHGTTILLITHDLGVVASFCDRVAVMYAGAIVEQGDTVSLFRQRAHPYTEALLRSTPRLDDPCRTDPRTHADRARLYSIPGRPPYLLRPPSCCTFAPRCPYAIDRCKIEIPTLEPSPGAHREPATDARCFVPPGSPNRSAPETQKR